MARSGHERHQRLRRTSRGPRLGAKPPKTARRRRDDDADPLDLSLFAVAEDVRYVHDEAYLSEPT